MLNATRMKTETGLLKFQSEVKLASEAAVCLAVKAGQDAPVAAAPMRTANGLLDHGQEDTEHVKAMIYVISHDVLLPVDAMPLNERVYWDKEVPRNRTVRLPGDRVYAVSDPNFWNHTVEIVRGQEWVTMELGSVLQGIIDRAHRFLMFFIARERSRLEAACLEATW